MDDVSPKDNTDFWESTPFTCINIRVLRLIYVLSLAVRLPIKLVELDGVHGQCLFLSVIYYSVLFHELHC